MFSGEVGLLGFVGGRGSPPAESSSFGSESPPLQTLSDWRAVPAEEGDLGGAEIMGSIGEDGGSGGGLEGSSGGARVPLGW